MFPFRENCSIAVDSETEVEKDKIEISCDEVSSTDDIFGNVHSPENFDLVDNFNPSLFCPDIILELEDTPILINDDDLNVTEFESPFLGTLEVTRKNANIDATIDLIAKENEVGKKTFGSANAVQYTKIHCTACGDHLGSALSEQDNRFVHPLLKVLVCGECYDFYASGEFEKEEDGSEVYCRWCGQGGQVVCCSRCEFVFCTTCIRNNLGRRKLAEIKGNDDWACFGCDPSQIIELRGHCAEFMEYIKKEISRAALLADAQSLVTIDYSRCCPKLESSSGKSSLPLEKNMLVAPKETHATNDIETSITDNGHIKKTIGIPLSTIKPMPSTSSNSPNVPPLSSNPHQIKILLPNGHRLITTNNKPQMQRTTQNVPSNIPLRTITIPNSSPNREAIQKKKSFYAKTVRSSFNVSSDLSRELSKMRQVKVDVASLKDTVVEHNRLQDVLSRSIRCLMQLQRELTGRSPLGNSETKCTHSTITNRISNN